MKKILFLLISILVLSGCFSQKSHIRQQGHTKVAVDTIKKYPENLYVQRLTEKIVQLKDYIGMISNDKANQESKSYYAHKAKDLFALGSAAIIKENGNAQVISVDSFFCLLKTSAITLCSVDSVYVPMWGNDLFNNGSDSIVYAKSQKITCNSFMSGKEAKGALLPVLIENTEDGKEPIPLLGNLIVQTAEFKKTDVDTLPVETSQPLFEFSLNKDSLMKALYQCRVKLVDEFFDRFNGKEGRADIKSEDVNYRTKNLLLLFDGQLFQSAQDSIFKEAQNMVKTIMTHDTQINYSDTTWIAKAECQALFKGKPTLITLYLNVEKRKEDMYKWVINRAEGDILRLSPSLQSDNIMLMPDDHETNFMSLHRITTEKDDYITLYGQKGLCINETSVFYSYIYNGLLDIDHVSDLEFVFLQVPGYIFTIKQIERDTYNSGWLIHSFQKTSNAEKELFLNSIYKQNKKE